MSAWRGIFWSKSFYADALTQGRSLGFGALALVTLATTLILGAYLVLGADLAGGRAQLDALVAKLPSIRFENGRATALVEPQPHVVRPDEEDASFQLVFDTRRTEAPLDLIKPYAGEKGVAVYVTGDTVTTYDARKSEWRAYEFKKFVQKDMTLTSADYSALAVKAATIGGVVAGLMVWLFKWVGALLMASLIGAIGLLRRPGLERAIRRPVGYRDLVRTASYSLVPVLLLQALLKGQASLWIVMILALVHYFFVLSLAERGLREGRAEPAL